MTSPKTAEVTLDFLGRPEWSNLLDDWLNGEEKTAVHGKLMCFSTFSESKRIFCCDFAPCW